MFIYFMFQYLSFSFDNEENSTENEGFLSKETLKILMWLSAMMAIISHLMPKKGLDDGKGANGSG